ncbi:MAG: hypothetical protein ABW224_16455 [Kibdelosporangium sp.]
MFNGHVRRVLDDTSVVSELARAKSNLGVRMKDIGWRRRAARGIAVALSSVVATQVTVLAAPIAAAGEPQADVRVDVSVPRHILPRDGWSRVTTSVSNTGEAPASNVRLVTTLPENLHSSGWSTSSLWDCSSPNGWPMVLTCDLVEDLAPGTTSPEVFINVYPYQASPGDVISVDAVVTTSSLESDTSDNKAAGRLTIVGKGAIVGQVWLDRNANGVREPGEPGASGYGPVGVTFMSVDDEDRYGYANSENFPYYQSVPAKKFVAYATVQRSELAFTIPNVGDDAIDSDVELVSENRYELTARSAEFVVPENGTVTIDVGVVPVS